MHLLATPKCPALKLLRALHQLAYFLWRSRPEAGDVAIENQTEGYQWHDVGKEYMGRGPPEEAPRVQECQRAQEETGDEASEGARL